MGPRARIIPVAVAAILVQTGVAHAGMPSITLTDVAHLRIQTISFFLLSLLACARVVQAIWNSLRSDFTALPRLAFCKALGVVALWGLLFVLVLTMISGARELMTPGAWKKEGLTYRLADQPPAPPVVADEERPEAVAVRRLALDRLRAALWHYAQAHEGRFPPDRSAPEIPEETWQVPDPSGLRYLYEGGRAADVGATPLAYEPGIYGADRLVLLTNGEVRRMPLAEIRRALDGEGP
jgi:hypothetical protein